MLSPRVLTSTAAALALTLSPLVALADWEVKSEFRMHLTESTFDKIIQDFWQSLQGQQKVDLGSVPVNLGDMQLAINGVSVNVDYSFPIPQRVDQNHREWKLKSDRLGVSINVAQLVVSGVKVVNIGGVVTTVPYSTSCDNIQLYLPSGSASIEATVRAEVAQNQVQLSMPKYAANWPSGAWQMTNISCFAGLESIVKEQVLAYLSSFENVDASLSAALHSQFETWSAKASLLLLSRQELPTNSDYVRAFYEPATAAENNGDGLIMGGTIRLLYPYVAKGQHFEQSFPLPANSQLSTNGTPQLLVPFAAIKAVMMGEYFANQLEYTMHSNDLPAFQSLLGSFWKKLFGWPDLFRFSTSSAFLFQFLPMGPPSFDGERASGENQIDGDLNLPLAIRMFAPDGGQFTPYVEFRTLLSGPASMTLGADGKINFKITATEQPLTYAFSNAYVQAHNPNQHIAAKTIASATRDALNTEGITLNLPTFKVGTGITLVPSQWVLQDGGVLKLGFNANVANVATALTSASTAAKTTKATTVTKAVKTTNGRSLVYRETRVK